MCRLGGWDYPSAIQYPGNQICRLGGDWVRQCAVGLSGVVFGLIVADNAASRATHRSIFGCALFLNTWLNNRRRRCYAADLAAGLAAWHPASNTSAAVHCMSCGRL